LSISAAKNAKSKGSYTNYFECLLHNILLDFKKNRLGKLIYFRSTKVLKLSITSFFKSLHSKDENNG
jgi:hypothetical protein